MKVSHKIWIMMTVMLVAALIGVVVWLSVWLYGERMRADNARMQMEYVYENALHDSLDSVSEMENSLAKLLVSGSRAENMSIAADVYKDAAAAAEVVGRLPVDMYEHTGLQKFLNQVGDFAASYIRSAGSGADVSAYEEQFDDIHSAAAEVRRQLAEAAGRIGTDGYSVINDIDAGLNISVGVGEAVIEYPSIIYDGPFSDADNESSWKGLDGLPEISEEQALAVARDKLGIEGGKIVGISTSAAVMYEIEGTAGGADAYASVTKCGGMIASAAIGRETEGKGRLGEDEAAEKALEYAEALGYCGCLTPVWYNESGSAAVINLAPESDGIIYYPDLVKIKVSLTDGALLGAEACGYCANHCERAYPPARMTPASAEKCVSSRLTVTNVRLAVIPKGSSERLCYEVAGTDKGLDYFVYVDACDGTQVDILRVIDDEQGKLVA